MQPRHFFITASIIGVIMAAAPAYANSISTKDFVHNASIANEFEIESSKLALEKSHNSDVKSFARRMVDDHTKTGEKMKETLHSSKSHAKAAEALDRKHQKLLDKLQSASSGSFDDEYVSIQMDAHKEAVSLFSDYSEHGRDSTLRNFATETLPTLKDHLQHVEDLKANH